MPNPFIASLTYAAVGLFVVLSGRKAYFHPIETLKRSHSYLPIKDWSRKLLRAFSVFWVFGGILVMLSGVAPYIHKFAGFSLVLVIVPIAIAGTFFLLHKETTTKS